MENTANVLRKVYSAILAGQLIVDERGKVYAQEFGQAFIDEIEAALKSVPDFDTLDYYRDGGTQKILYKRKIYFVDNRIGSKTKGAIYKGYPGEDDSRLLYNSLDEMIKAHL